ncbi:hypothetical protein SSX86_029662 [Deinandra increscens subsp. villosa]|uniref:Zinc finger CCCH domain-containing protein 13 n=1 Tax=Deinandra increscens subsp. villosa TaxID=3103831 RepID=A0AAP0CG32_9ASTR
MPRSSRSKSHKQSKHSSKEAAAREYSGSDEDVKVKERSSNGGKEDVVPVKISANSSVSGERVKHSKDLSNSHGNGDISEEHSASLKRREEKSHGVSDRWNGGSSDDKGLLMNIENKELLKSKDLSKVVGESKSKSSRRHDGDSVGLVVLEKDESKSGSGHRSEKSEKRKSEKTSGRKESSQHKEHKESKEKDRGSDRGRKVHHDKHGAEESSKHVENQSSKRGKEITEWPIEEELRNPELEKELEKRMRRRGEASNDKHKYQDDIKETEDRRLSTRNDSSRDERHKNEEYGDIKETRQKDEKHREDSERDRKNRDLKRRGESERYSKHRDDKHREEKYSEDGNKKTKNKDDKYIDIGDKDERSRDGKHRQDDDRDYRYKEEKRARDSRYEDVPEAKRVRDDNVGTDLYHRKTSNRDASPVHDDRVARYKDDKDRRRGNEKDESSDYRSRSSMKEQRSEIEKRSSAKDDLVSERGRLSSRNADVEITTSHSRRRSSPSGNSYPTRDHHRVSKQEETKYRDYAYEDRARHNVHSSRDHSSAPGQSDKKVSSKDDSYMGGDLSGEKRTRLESRSSPQVNKSPSSNDRRDLIKSDARKSIDLEELGTGPRSGGSKDTFKDGKGSRELVNEAHMNNDFLQIDNDNLSVSSPYSRNSHFSGNSKSLLPPPSPSTFRTGSDSPFFGSTEDERSKPNTRHRRMVDPNMNRGQNQIQSQGNWKNVSNWPSPMATGGYMPFQHVPPPMFHPLMQQFPPPLYGRPPMKLNPGLPYHATDHGRPLGWRNQVDESVPPPLHGWDANNSAFGDEAHLYGRLDWDRRSQLSNQGWDQSGEIWKGQNAGLSMEVQLGQQKDDYMSHRLNDENLSGPTGQPDENEQNQVDIQSETLNLDKNGPDAQKSTGSPKIFEVVKEDNKAIITQAYLSRVDVSKDLTQPELYDQCTSIMDLDQEDCTQPVELDCKILYLEESLEVNVTDSASLFTAINDSVFQKAMFLYNKQKEEFHSTKAGEPPNKPEEAMDMEINKPKGGLDDDGKSAGEVAAAEDTVMEINKENDELPNKPEEVMDMEVDGAVVKQEEVPESTVAEVKESLAPSAASGGLLPCKVEDETGDDMNGGGGDSSVLSDVSTAEVAVMPTESVEFGSVNLNRIHHHSPESTH